MSYDELIKLLKTAKSAEEIDKYREEIAELIPQVRRMFDYDQKNHAHQFDLWMQDHYLFQIRFYYHMSQYMVCLGALIFMVMTTITWRLTEKDASI